MTTAKQAEANRRNALASTGPKSPAGKARVAKNSIRHGLSSTLPVLPGLERTEDWERHRAGLFQSLAPVGALEEALAGRVILCSWRLDRAVRYETAVTAVGLEELEDQLRPKALKPPDTVLRELGDTDNLPVEVALAKAIKKLERERETVEAWEGSHRLLGDLLQLHDEAPVDGDDVFGVLDHFSSELPGSEDNAFDIEDKKFLASLGVPADQLDEAFQWDGWTAGRVRAALEHMARVYKANPQKILAQALRGRKEVQAEGSARVKALERKVKELRRRSKDQASRLQRERMLPGEETLQKITRYEAHLSRQLYQALHELQRLQAVRAGEAVPAPSALDITLDASGGAAAALEAATGA
jgi:hypothetical protein